MLRMAQRVSTVAMGLALMACATHGSYLNADFLSPAEDVSTAWVAEGNMVYLVPEKGVIVDRVVDSQGRDIPWQVLGSYMTVNMTHIPTGSDAFWLQIEGNYRMQRIGLPTP